MDGRASVVYWLENSRTQRDLYINLYSFLRAWCAAEKKLFISNRGFRLISAGLPRVLTTFKSVSQPLNPLSAWPIFRPPSQKDKHHPQMGKISLRHEQLPNQTNCHSNCCRKCSTSVLHYNPKCNKRGMNFWSTRRGATPRLLNIKRRTEGKTKTFAGRKSRKSSKRAIFRESPVQMNRWLTKRHI